MHDTVQKVTDTATALNRSWDRRPAEFRRWYKLLQQFNDLRQEGMESVISNDPRTFYNLAMHLLNSPRVPHRIPTENLTQNEIDATSAVERVVRRYWRITDRRYRRTMRQTWSRHTLGLMLITGWYAVRALATQDELRVDSWNPAEVFPDSDREDLTLCTHDYMASVKSIKAQYPTLPLLNNAGSLRVIDFWEKDEGRVYNSVVVGNRWAKAPTEEPYDEIPIYTGPVGGLPDDGTIMQSELWRREIGQSILAPNVDLYRNYNRIFTFLQQLARDNAQAPLLKKNVDLTADQLFLRGAIIELGSSGEIPGYITKPPLPVELQQLLFAYDNMLQRGSVPYALFGNVQQQIAGILMTQIADSASQILSPFHEAYIGLLDDIDNNWARAIVDNIYTGDDAASVNREMLPPDVFFSNEYPIIVPGDLVNRATILNMLSPGTRISGAQALDLFLPEVADPDAELARTRAELAQQHPAYITITLIESFLAQADQLRQAGNPEAAARYEAAAKMAEASLNPAPAQEGAQQSRGAPPNGIPPNLALLLQQMQGGEQR